MQTVNVVPSGALYTNPSESIYPDYYYSFVSQRMANLWPFWTKLRQDPSGSFGQQYLNAGVGSAYLDLEANIDNTLDDKFITTAHLDEIDHLYKSLVPATLDLTNPGISGVKVITAPSGYPLSDPDYQTEVREVSTLNEFYQFKPPTRVQLVASGAYDSSLGLSFSTRVVDPVQKFIEFTKIEHDIAWEIQTDSLVKEDSLTSEVYQSYSLDPTGYSLKSVAIKDRLLYSVATNGDQRELWVMSTLTPLPEPDTLTTISRFDLSFIPDPSGISVDQEGFVWVTDTPLSKLWKLKLLRDYFILDKTERTIFMLEDYFSIFIKPVYY